MIYEDIFSVPIIKNAYKSYRVSFSGESRNSANSETELLNVKSIFNAILNAAQLMQIDYV